jgi:hypothetical protein
MFFEIWNQTQTKPDPNRTKPKRTGSSRNFISYYESLYRKKSLVLSDD